MTRLAPAMLGELSWPEISLLFFLALFVALVLRLVLSRSARWKSDARIPLDDEKPVERRRACGDAQKEAKHHA